MMPHGIPYTRILEISAICVAGACVDLVSADMSAVLGIRKEGGFGPIDGLAHPSLGNRCGVLGHTTERGRIDNRLAFPM